MPNQIVERERNERGLVAFIDSLRVVLIAVRNLEVNHTSTDEIENILFHLEESATTLILISAHVETNGQDAILRNFKNSIDTVLDKVKTLCQVLTNYIGATEDWPCPASYRAPTSSIATGPGRPPIIIQRDQIEFLRELQFSWAKIARLLGVSQRYDAQGLS